MQLEPPFSQGKVDPLTGTGSYLRIGHRGAAALAPENTIASLAAALEHGVDVVEFDVVDAPGGALVLAHSREEIGPDAVGLDDALAFVAREAPAGVGIDVDVKRPGFEAALTDALRRHGLLGRALASSFLPRSLRRLRELEPGLPTGLSYPWDRRGLADRPALTPLVRAGAAALRAALPHRVAGMASAALASSAMLHHSVLSAAAVRRCHAAGISVFAWTVDDPGLLEQVLAMGVDGVVSNDPRIFGPGREPRYDR